MKCRVFRLKQLFQVLVVVLITGLILPEVGMADGLTDCMMQKMQQASDTTTIGELREKCRARQHNESPDDDASINVSRENESLAGNDEQATAVDIRLQSDRENVLQPFTLMPHKPNYFMVAAYNLKSYNSDLYKQEFANPDLEFDDTEAQFQMSIKVPLGINLFDRFDVYAAYTNRSFWQVYNADISSPFRETNHEPEAWVQFTPGWEFLGFKNSANAFGVVHQSNGRGGVLSRSWNRFYANFVFQRGNFALGFKPWIRISEDADVDDNPDITDYLGHYELRAGYKWNKHLFSVMSRNNLESGFERGAVELSWSFPIWTYPYMKGYIQYFRGYGESLIDYDQRVNRIGIGISLTDWL